MKVVAVLVVSFVIGACNGRDISDRRKETALAIQCKADKDLLATELGCQLDEDCPCGAHCELGLCTASCTKSSECDLGSCDAFGRCTETAGLIPQVATAVAAEVSLFPAYATLDDAGLAFISLEAAKNESGPVRVIVDAPLEVSCDGESYASSCLIPNLSPEMPEPGAVSVRRAEGDEQLVEEALVTVHWSAGSSSARVLLAPPGTVAFADSTIACTALESGIYEGSARLVAIGSSSAPGAAAAFQNELANVRVPLRAEIFPNGDGSGRVRINDELGAVFGPKGAFGDLSDSAGLLLQTSAYLHEAGPAAQVSFAENAKSTPVVFEHTVDIGVAFAPSQMACKASYLSGLLDASFVGLIGDAPFLRWEVQLRRSSALADGQQVPSLPPVWQRDLPLDAEFVPVPLPFNDVGKVKFSTKDSRFRLDDSCFDRESCACTGVNDVAETFDTTSNQVGLTGDLRCNTAAPHEQRLFPLLGRTTILESDVEDCLADLAVAKVGGLVTNTDACVEADRVLFFLEADLANGRQQALAPPGLAQDETTNKLVLRSLQQWLSISWFVAHDAKAIHLLHKRNVDPNDPIFEITPPTYSLAEALASSVDASALLLHPLVAPGLEGMVADHIKNPDYRPLLDATPPIGGYPRRDQNVGLPVGMLRTQAVQLDTLATLAQIVIQREAPLSEIGPVYAKAIRTILPALALAEVLQRRASSPPPSWQPEWENSESLVAVALVEALTRYQAASRGENEFDIPLGVLPLARIGDETGALSKFSALSDFLLGPPGSSLAVAPAMVQRASTKLAAARQAWLAVQTRDLNESYADLAQDRRENEIAEQYGEALISLCGDASFETGRVLDDEGNIDPSNCYIRNECRPTFAERSGPITSADIGYGLCVHGFLRKEAGAAARTSGDPEFDRLADAMPDDRPGITLLGVSPSATEDLLIDVQWANTDIRGIIEPRKHRFPAITSPLEDGGASLGVGDDLLAADAYCRTVWNKGDSQRPRLLCSNWNYDPHSPCSASNQARECDTSQDCPRGRDCRLYGVCEFEEGQYERDAARQNRLTGDACYQGALGQSVIALKAAQAAVGAATERLKDHTRAYEIRMETCYIKNRMADQLKLANSRHNRRLAKLQKAKKDAENSASIVDAITSVFTFESIDDLNPKKLLGFAGLAVTAGLAAADAYTDISVNEAEALIEEAQQDFETEIRNITIRYEAEICFNDASFELIGSQAAAFDLAQAKEVYKQAVAVIMDQQSEVRRLVEEGRETLAAERSLTRPTIEGDFWLNDDIEEYEKALRQAKRAVFLAVLGAEWEFQISSIEGDKALAARSPEELAQVVERLRAWTGTGTVAGSNPTDLVNVVSVRDHVLQVASNKNTEAGFYDLTESERFRLMLVSPNFAVYDNQGVYQGQEVSFNLLPSSRTGLEDTSGIEILSGEDCAERIWSVNASILGNNLHTTDTNLSRITLRKSNSFFSQWCGGFGPDGSDYQNASSTRANLFVDPLSFGDGDLPQVAAAGDSSRTFTSARLQPRFNVPQDELESEGYFEGDSQELAGRGLYGEYSLFIPAQSMALNGGEGLVLSQVEDILLRFDYVSVAKP
jgi:hypothetical protein